MVEVSVFLYSEEKDIKEEQEKDRKKKNYYKLDFETVVKQMNILFFYLFFLNLVILPNTNAHFA